MKKLLSKTLGSRQVLTLLGVTVAVPVIVEVVEEVNGTAEDQRMIQENSDLLILAGVTAFIATLTILIHGAVGWFRR